MATTFDNVTYSNLPGNEWVTGAGGPWVAGLCGSSTFSDYLSVNTINENQFVFARKRKFFRINEEVMGIEGEDIGNNPVDQLRYQVHKWLYN